ncbi:hypothetical protein DRN84_00810 [Candidatus Geothermarchaeota archaeon]|nr:MAG: hypothetical protein DRN87_01125 [Candidatus Geothermarchaeota archaeon]RLG62847.1 MAG: hypothetical protein DRN84_00810 [Candidatus Geothermarchaeota archaeon]HEW94373.1 class I SAM-dependent methyltransferase [Thermoprotei archaeon]
MYIPYYPSNWEALKKLIKILNLPAGTRFVDLGSGGGRVLAVVSKEYDDIEVYGVEKNPYLIEASRRYLDRYRLKAKIIQGDLFSTDLSRFDVVYGYLTVDALKSLRDRIIRFIDSGKVFITLDFNIPGLKPAYIVKIDSWPGRHRLNIYGKRGIKRYINL